MRRVPEWEAAKIAGEQFYWTGRPCRNGHVSKRSTASGNCCVCTVNKTLRWMAKAPEHPNRIAAREAELLHFSTGRPCAHGHDRRFVSNGLCVDCQTERTGRWKRQRPGLEAEWARKRRAKDPTGHRKSSGAWAKRNRAKVNATLKRWKLSHPEQARERSLVASARERSKHADVERPFTPADIRNLYDRQTSRCAACQKKGRLELDHILAIARGGTSHRSNMQLLCGPCNRSKGSKDAIVWAQSKGRLL